LCGFDIDGDGRNDIYTWNGLAGYYERFPLKVPVGELVRIYLMNMLDHDPLASFHLHAQTFDVYRSGTSLIPQERTDIVGLGPAERVILEFRLPRRGRYMFHPHQSHMAERGAMGWIVAI
jgi:nitrite reductase (NO-forming)